MGMTMYHALSISRGATRIKPLRRGAGGNVISSAFMSCRKPTPVKMAPAKCSRDHDVEQDEPRAAA